MKRAGARAHHNSSQGTLVRASVARALPQKVLILNVGSSTVKASLYDDKLHLQWSAEREFSTASSLASIEKEIRDLSPIDLVGHRIVHGGPTLRATTWIDADVKAQIDAAAELAPVHNRNELAAIQDMERILGPNVPQAAVFDTAFHATLPTPAYVYSLPYEWLSKGIRRYGFHGISHQYVSRRAAEILGRDLASLRLISCHLGNGCSLAAVRGGICIDTTMGFTPLEGLMMGSRSGSIDPGILIHQLRYAGATAESLDRTLNNESGLKGVSGISSDMREILAARARGHERATLAFDIYIHRLRSEIGAMLASLAGLDALIFTGGIGEHSPEVRAAACEAFAFLGLELDSAKTDGDIATSKSTVRALVIATQENEEIARECLRLYARIGFTTFPATSVSRKCRP
ncbi:MAG TPA: acetate kinase [Bryobacteraceae bacterium]|nr:acetate kinase [Bryobacteraceae bacterium]